MINPNKNYKTSMLGIIVHVDSPDAYIPYLKVRMENGSILEGSLERSHTFWKSLKVGTVVGIEGQFSIVADKFMIARVIKKRLNATMDALQINNLKQSLLGKVIGE